MKTSKITILAIASIFLATTVITGCKASRTAKGAAVGAGSGAVIGAVVGRAAGNTALGALIGATVGGATGAIIGNKMDKQAKEIEQSVPGVKVYRVGEGIIVEFADKILFGFDQAELNANSYNNLNKLITVLEKYPDTDIEIQGHTDNTGTDKYNMTLSLKRATSVSQYLKSKGVASSRVSTKGYGETAPNYDNDTEESRAKNRRVEFLITANEKMRKESKIEAESK